MSSGLLLSNGQRRGTRLYAWKLLSARQSVPHPCEDGVRSSAAPCPPPATAPSAAPCPPPATGPSAAVDPDLACVSPDAAACPAGTWGGDESQESDAACLDCPRGHFCTIGSTSPVPCPSGFVAAGLRSRQCTACRPGEFQDGIAQAECKICPVGRYCPAGSSLGTACPAGTWSSRAGRVNSTQCEGCVRALARLIEPTTRPASLPLHVPRRLGPTDAPWCVCDCLASRLRDSRKDFIAPQGAPHRRRALKVGWAGPPSSRPPSSARRALRRRTPPRAADSAIAARQISSPCRTRATSSRRPTASLARIRSDSAARRTRRSPTSGSRRASGGSPLAR